METHDGYLLCEMIYQRMRAAINLCMLVALEEELECCIQRALATATNAAVPQERSHALARQHLDQAWQRLEKDWRRVRPTPGSGWHGGEESAGEH